MLEIRAGFLIDDESPVGMMLQRGGGDTRRDRPFDSLRDRSRLRRAAGEQQNAERFEKCADAHRSGGPRNFFAGLERFAIVVDGFFRQNFQARAGAKARSRLVESDMPVAADAEDLQVDSAGVADGLLVSGAIAIVIFRNRAVGDVDVFRFRVHMPKQILVHEVGKALGMRRWKAEIFVEIEADDAGKIERLFAMHANEFAVEGEHRAAGGEAEANLGIAANGAGDDARAFAAELCLVGFENEEHVRDFAGNRLNRFKRIIPAALQVDQRMSPGARGGLLGAFEWTAKIRPPGKISGHATHYWVYP